MKIKHSIALAISINFFAGILFAQDSASVANSYQRKHHIILGTDVLNYTTGSYTDYMYVGQNTYPSQNTPSQKTSYHSFSAKLNLWVGYFISDRFFVGLTFGNTRSTNYDYFPSYYGFNNYSPISVSPFIPSSLQLRYYLTKGVSEIGNLFLEGNIGGEYSNTGAAGYYPLTFLDISANVNIGLACNVSSHFAVLIKAGAILDFEHVSTTVTANNMPPYAQTESYTEDLLAPAFTCSLGLQYKF